jgi:hypothetical protein
MPTWVFIGLALGLIALLLRRPLTTPGAPAHWSWPATGAAVGALGVLAWLTGAPAGWRWGLSITGPSRSLAEAGLLAASDSFHWGTLMLLGIPLGTWASARLLGPTAWRSPDGRELPRRFAGGLAMGIGGTVAGGCNIGNAMTGLSVLSVHSAIATLGIAVGAGLALLAEAVRIGASGTRNIGRAWRV